jgi:hypothetical protein
MKKQRATTQNNKYTMAALCCVLVLMLTGCFGGSRGLVRFNELNYPASMSSYLYGPNDDILAVDRDLIVIKRLRVEVNYPAIFYSLAPPMHARDVGKQINSEVGNCGGEGIVNVKISSHTGYTTHMHPLTLLPFWPSFTKVVVEGDIVKYEPSLPRTGNKSDAFDITNDVLIVETKDETATVRLNEQCHSIGKIDTLFAEEFYSQWVSNGRSWMTMYSIDVDESAKRITMQHRVKIEARQKEANVAQILFVTFDQPEVKTNYENAKATKSEPGFIRGEAIGAALALRYWSCPTNHSQ